MTRRRFPIPDLYAALDRLLAQIPRGRVATYSDLGDALGTPRAARWVAQHLAARDYSDKSGCHRVVRQTGELGGWSGGDENDKAAILRKERVEVAGGHVDLCRYGFSEFRTRRPLARLLRYQDELREEISLKAYRASPKRVAGVDLSYDANQNSDRQYACATYAVVDAESLDLVDSYTIRRRVRFPYISGFLSFREAPILLELLEHVHRKEALAPVVLVDGNGIMHPRRVGVATFVGVVADVRTIGVGKSFLCGDIEGDDSTPASTARAIRLDGRKVGYAVGNTDQSRPVFVSPGHKLTLTNALDLTRSLFRNHRVPEPIYHADRISRAAIKGE